MVSRKKDEVKQVLASFSFSKMEANSFIFAPIWRVPSYTSGASSIADGPTWVGGLRGLDFIVGGGIARVAGASDKEGAEIGAGTRGEGDGRGISTTSSSLAIEPSSRGVGASSQGRTTYTTLGRSMWGFFTTADLDFLAIDLSGKCFSGHSWNMTYLQS